MKTNPIYRTAAWRAARRMCLERDGHVCQIRLPGCRGRANSADHIVELENGGAPYALENLQAACMSCNVAKGNIVRGVRKHRGAAPRVRVW